MNQGITIANDDAVEIARGLVGEFYSDTKTLPTQGVRDAIASAEVGDEQKGEDPSANELCRRVAELLGKESAIFMVAGTMCNQVAMAVHCKPSDEILLGRTSHILEGETGGAAAIANAITYPLDGERGMFTGQQVAENIRPVGSNYMPDTGLVCVEQTTNLAGGAIWPLEQLRDVANAAHEAGVPTHMDGARLLNAVVKTGIPAADYAEGFDSVWIDFTKGLGAPVGAVMAGTEEFITRVRRVRQRMGGGFRQGGIIAAGCLYTLDHQVERLAEDHERADRIAETLKALPKVDHVYPGDTNIVMFDTAADGPTADELVDSLMERGYRIGAFPAFGPRRVRIVTHLNVGDEQVDGLRDQLTDLLS